MSVMTDKVNISCDIIKDLLPLYCDNAVSDATKSAVEEHLQDCKECAEEYRLMCADLEMDIKEKDNDGKRPSAVSFLKNLRKKAVVKGIVITAVAAAVIGGALYALLGLPVRLLDSNKMEVVRAYKTDDTFYLYFYNDHSQRQYGNYDFDEGKKELKLEVKAPIIQFGDDSHKFEDIWTVPAENLDCETITLNGEVIWSVNENSDDEIPEYVYEYLEFEKATDERGWFADKNIQGVTYEDGTMKVWNLDGDLLYSGKASDYDGGED